MVERTPGVIVKVLVSAVLLGVGTTALALTPDPAPDYKMVDDIVDHLGDLDGRVLRAHGWVQAGSIRHLTEHVVVFTLTKDGKNLAVWHEGPLPDTFKDQSEVVVKGTLRGEVIRSDELMAKCGGKYDGARDLSTRFE